MNKNKNDDIYIGHIVNTFGIKGELKVYSESDFINERFQIGKKIYLKFGNHQEEHKISSMRVHKKNILITIDECYNINEIEHLVGSDIYASADDEIMLEDNDYYIDDLIGCKVYNMSQDYLGEVVDVLEMPKSYLLEIKKDDSKFYLPFVDAYVKEIYDDKIIIEEIEGIR